MYIIKADAIPTAVTAQPIVIRTGFKAASAIISAASAYPKGVIYFSQLAFSVILATILRK